MYQVHYYNTSGDLRVKDLESLDDVWKFVSKLPKESVSEIKHYENSDNYRPTFWSEE